MPFYLKHNFDPDFDFNELRPVEQEDGSVDHYNLGYTQNVLKGQVVAEWSEVTAEEAELLDSRFIHTAIKDFVGKNCFVPAAKPNQIVAAANGFVFYLDGLINVKKVLNVRRSVDSRTGHIGFVGDVIVHEDVKAGFEVRGNNVRVMGGIESACKVVAGASLVVDHGVKGGGTSLLRAKENIKLDFCENADLQANKILLDTASLHSNLYATQGLAVQGKLIGGSCYTNGSIFVGRQLGGGMSTITSLVLGFHPKLIAKKMEIEQELEEKEHALFVLDAKMRKNPAFNEKDEEYTNLVADVAITRGHLQKIRKEITQRLNLEARVVVRGEVRPGVLINIGGVELKVNDFLQDVCFYLEGREIKWQSPALSSSPDMEGA